MKMLSLTFIRLTLPEIKKHPHSFYTNGAKIVVPGAAVGVSLFGDNAFGETVDFFNPLSDVGSTVGTIEGSIIPSLFRFIDEHLMGPPPRQPKRPAQPEPTPHVTVKICDDQGNCQVQ